LSYRDRTFLGYGREDTIHLGDLVPDSYATRILEGNHEEKIDRLPVRRHGRVNRRGNPKYSKIRDVVVTPHPLGVYVDFRGLNLLLDSLERIGRISVKYRVGEILDRAAQVHENLDAKGTESV
jgi:hypothetical protein